MDRRTFVATSAAAGAATALPALAGSRQAKYPIPAPSNDYCVNVKEHGPDRIYPTLAEAKESLSYRHDKPRFEMRPFEPLDNPIRFRVIRVEWELPSPHELGLGHLADARFHRLYEIRREATDEMLPYVNSLIDVFHGIAGHDEFWDDDAPEVYDRATGLAVVAERNAAVLDEDNLDWHVLIEIGKPLSLPLNTITLCANGIGTFDEMQTYPVRLVRPTASELASYPLPDGDE